MEEEKIETYSPTIDEQNRLPVSANTDGFEDVLGSDGLISTRLNEKVIIERIAKDLYKNATSGLRELYNNSARACRIAVKKHGETHPLIRVTMNEETRMLVIQDNGLGISKERFKKVLLELGTSDNLDKGEVGQFGMGFASYTTLSSVIIIDTRARNDDQYKMVAKDGRSFQPVGDSTIDGYGTRLEMTCYSEVNFSELIVYLEEVATYSSVPTILELNGFNYYPRGYGAGENFIEQHSFDDDVENHKDDYSTDVIDIDTEDFRFIALATGQTVHSKNNNVHLLNVPIESKIKTPFTWWVLNIKDERKFKPMPDRDRMRESSDELLSSMLDKAIKNYFSDLKIKTYQEFLESLRQNEFLWLSHHVDYAPVDLRPILNTMAEVQVRKVVYDIKTLIDGSLAARLAKNKDIVYQGYKNREITQKIREFKPNAMLITIKKTAKTDWRQHVEFMTSFGIPNGKQILIDNKVKMPKNEAVEFELIGHTHAEWYNHDVVALDDIDENFIRCDSVPIINVLKYVKNLKTPYTFVRNADELEEYDCRSFSEWLKNDIPRIVCATNKGAMTIKEIVEKNEEFIFCTDFMDEFVYFLKDDKRIIIYGGSEQLAMAFYLNPECAITTIYSKWMPNGFKRWSFTMFVAEKYDVNLNSDFDKKFFCTNMMKINPCFHTLFGSLLNSVSYDMKDDVKEHVFKGYLETILEFTPFDGEDEIAKLRFYYAEYSKMADSKANITTVLENLLNRTKQTIMGNDYLKARLMKEVLVPKVFGHIEFRSMVKEELAYKDTYEVNLATHDTEFNFKDDLKVFDFELHFRGLKMKINKGYCSIKVLVYIES